MIDIHSHILPMIDDGAQSVEQALEMLDLAYRDGTDEIILTPHLAYEYSFINPKEKIISLFNDLKRIVKQAGIPIQLYLGTEFLFSSPEVFEEHLDEIMTMNHSKYLLIEFFFDESAENILLAIDAVLKHGLIPIIAHPERYDCIQYSLNLLDKIVSKGALLQMNKSSIIGRYGEYAREVAIEMLDRNLVHFIGSDTHHPKRRTPMMYSVYSYILETYGKDYAADIFENNARKMLENKDIRK